MNIVISLNLTGLRVRTICLTELESECCTMNNALDDYVLNVAPWNYMKSEALPMLNLVHTTPWRHMEELSYSFARS